MNKKQWACNLRLHVVKHKGDFQVWTFDHRANNGGPVMVDAFGSLASVFEQATHYGWKYLDTNGLRRAR